MEVNPKLTRAQLKEKHSKRPARTTRAARDDGRVRYGSLPAVTTDAKWAASKKNANRYISEWHDPKGDKANRELSKRIRKAVKDLKKSNKGVPQFLLAWRLYPNAEHPRWQRRSPHACGCGCGCGSLGDL